MIYVGFIILFFTAVQLSVAVANLLFSLDLSEYKKPVKNLVSILIPARNEEKNIANLLTDLQNQDYQNLEIMVFSDQSTDATVSILKQFAEKDGRIRYYDSDELPDGWLGKNYACHFLSTKANGKHFLFLDADVRIGRNIIENTVSYTEKYNLGLLSIFPAQIMRTVGEKITVPNMNYILLSLLPLSLVRKSRFPSLAAANGQFMLFQADCYKIIRPHEVHKYSKVEDIEIARLYKKRNEFVACLTGNSEVSCRMYEGLEEAVNGFSKNVVMFFGNSYFLTVLFWLVTTFGFIVVYSSFYTSIFLIYLAAIVLIRILISLTSKQPVLQNLVLAIPQQGILGIIIFRAIFNKFNKQYKWKGRNIS